MLRFALAGNPNSGKTTLFNSLTGSTAHVGNWPGVTVEKKVGTYKKLEEHIEIIDLPGIYSLSPYTNEEVITRNYIIDEHPDLLIDIVDATNIERNLYLTTQLLEISVPMVIALNMADILTKKGARIDIQRLEEKLGVPVVVISALKEEHLDELMKRAYETCKKPRAAKSVFINESIHHLINDIRIAFEGKGVENPLFHAIKFVENDELEVKNHPDLIKMVNEYKETYHDEVFGDDYEAIIADSRYKFIDANLHEVIVYDEKEFAVDKNDKVVKMNKSDKIDKIITHKVFGLLIFAAIMFLIFHLTFSENFLFVGKILEHFGATPSFEGSPYEGLFYSESGINSPGVILFNTFDMTFSLIMDSLKAFMQSHLGENLNWLSGFVCDGILAGVFSVLGFLPQIMLVFLFFSIMEDSGYMARVAFIFDKLFRHFGLSGRAFIPMIMGFGCSVPAMVNTRTIADDKERTATIRVIPFFSCSAKLPILTAISGGIAMCFGFKYVDIITYSMYVLGVVVAILAVLLMRNTTLKGESSPFMMELPEYHIPQFKALMLHLWDKAKHFVKKAFTVILASTIIIWFLTHFGWNWHYLDDNGLSTSILASIGQLLQPLFTPMGFGAQLTSVGWVFAVAAITGLVAKENVVAAFFTLAVTISVAFKSGAIGISNPDVLEALTEVIEAGEASSEGVSEAAIMLAGTGISWQGAICFIAFNMLTIPCFAACATAKAELPKGKFIFTLLFWLAGSYIVTSSLYAILSCFTTSGAQLAWAIPCTVAVILAVIAVTTIIIVRNLKLKKASEVK